MASAGNSGSSAKMYPAGYDLDNIISVAATDHNDELAGFSNWSNSWVDLGAPGVDVLSTVRRNKYSLISGTSMAAPHVAGVAGLVMAQFPGLSNETVKARILATVDPLPSLEGKTLTGGRLNALNAVGNPDLIPPDPVIDLAVDLLATTFDSITLTWTATGDDGTTGTASLYDVRYRDDGPITPEDWGTATQAQSEPPPQVSGSPESFTVTGLSGDTTYFLALKVADEVGNWSELSNVVSETTPAPPPGTWVTETVDTTDRVGVFSSIALDSSGNVHISSWDSTNGDAKYAKWNGFVWSIQTIPDPVDRVGRWTSIASGGPDDIHIVYLDDTNSGLRYARLTDSVWSFETVDANGGSWNSIVLDTGGNPHVSYNMPAGRDPHGRLRTSMRRKASISVTFVRSLLMLRTTPTSATLTGTTAG